MRLAVQHRTRYRFSRPVTDIIQALRLTPQSCLSQTVLEWRIDVDCDARLRESRDGYGNIVHMLYVNAPVTELAITATGRVITENSAGVVQGLPADLPPAVFLRATELTQPDEALRAFAAEAAEGGPKPLDLLHRINGALYEQMVFDTASTSAATPAAAAFAAKRGVCQDFAHIFVTASRLAGIPARYVSGHLFRRDGLAVLSASHAWSEAYVADLGWVAFDPANGICAGDANGRVATGHDYGEAAPIVGARRGGGDEQMDVTVQVSQIARRSQNQSQSQSQSGSGGS